MNKPILEPEEVAALMAHMEPEERAGALFASLPPIPQPEQVEPYRFQAGDRDTPERYPMLENLHSRLVEKLDEAWDELFKRDITIEMQGLSTQVYRDIIAESVSRVYFVFAAPEYGKILVTFDTPIIVACVDALLGGDGDAAGNAETLSPVELRLSERIARQVSDILVEVWKHIEPYHFTLLKLDTDPQFLAVTTSSEVCFTAQYTIKVGDQLQGSFHLHYPKPFLEPVLDRLRTTITDQPKDTDSVWSTMLQQALAGTTLPLHFQLDKLKLEIAQFLELQEGDELPLSKRRDDAGLLHTRGVPLFIARPGNQNGNLAAEIIETIHDGGAP